MAIENIWNHLRSDDLFDAIVANWLLFDGIHSYVFAILAFTIIDMVTSILKAVKLGEPITSRKPR